MNEKKFRDWIKLDNAANIYSATLSKKYAGMFRLSATLTENIDRKTLDKALKNVIKRFPTFSYKLKQGLFWHYFKYNAKVPKSQDDFNNPLLRMNFKENDEFMFRVRVFNEKIAVEYFHSLTDGTGGVTFLLTLIAEYLKLKYNIKPKYKDKVLNPRATPSKSEFEDSFQKYIRDIGGLVKEKPAFHQKGTLDESHKLNIITGKIPIAILKKKSQDFNCTITQFLASVMIDSLQVLQEKEVPNQSKRKPIKVSVPVNLRTIYKSNTMRNFSSYVNVGIETKYGHYPLEEITKEVKYNMDLLLSEKRLNSKITANVKLANNYFIRLIPMFLKKYVLSIADLLMGDRYVSHTLSNIGLIEISKEMSPYIKDLGFIIGKSRGKPGSGTCIGYNGNLYLSFSRKIKEAEFEKLFFRKIVEMGIPVEIESNLGGNIDGILC